jgi:hypothetical protein
MVLLVLLLHLLWHALHLLAKLEPTQMPSLVVKIIVVDVSQLALTALELKLIAM